MRKSDKYKIQVFCPINAVEKVRLAIGKAGGGIIGKYTYCASLTNGYGYFLPMKGSKPTIGKQGKIEKVREVKIETVCEEKKVKEVVRAIKKVHPYEEVSIDIFQLLDLE